MDDDPSTGDIDPAAQALAVRIGGRASQSVPGFGNREFDAVSDVFIAQTTASESVVDKPHNFLNARRKEQIRATLAAAKQEAKTAYFEFTNGEPHPDVKDFIARNAQRINASFVITEPE